MKLWVLKLKISVVAIAKVLRRPSYALIAVVCALLVLGVFLWIFNLDLFVYVLTNSDISVVEKSAVFAQSYLSLITNFENIAAIILVTFSILLGVNIALLVYVVRNLSASVQKEGGSGGLSLVAAVVGAGCAACGTSILAPFITVVGSTITIGLVEVIGIMANIVGIGLVTYSLYMLGFRVANIAAKFNKAT